MILNKKTLEGIVETSPGFDKETFAKLTEGSNFSRMAEYSLKEDPENPEKRKYLGALLQEYHADETGHSEFNPDFYANKSAAIVRRALNGNAKDALGLYFKAFDSYFKNHFRTIAEGLPAEELLGASKSADKTLNEYINILQHQDFGNMRAKLEKLYGQDAHEVSNEEIQSLFSYSFKVKGDVFNLQFLQKANNKDAYELSRSKIIEYIEQNYKKIPAHEKEHLSSKYIEANLN